MACDETDQRGVSRPQPANGRCDIGAVENACGNGVLEPNLGEQCDDGNQVGGDGCEALCTLPTSCNSPIVIPAAGGIFTGVTSGQGTLGGTCGKLGGAPEQVFQWTPDVSGSAMVETCGAATDYDTVLYVRQGGCVSGPELGCNDDACPNASGKGLASRLTFPVTAGQPYFIVVDGSGESRGSFSLLVTPPSAATTSSSSTSSTATSTTTSSVTTTTVVAACARDALPEDSRSGLACAVDAIRRTLAEAPQPNCAGRCHCSLERALARVSAAVAEAQGARTPRRCRRKLAAARARAMGFQARVRLLTERGCIAPTDRARRLASLARELTARTGAMSKSGFCAR